MHIRRLELQGFKSFKDKTVIHFDDGITGIVGPNGCGKSNVVDAFFWVMGEQNARHLRGQSMDDLIFSGADKAPPASYAEVTLVLEMPGELTGPNAPAGASTAATLPTREVSITRKLYRSGECDYFLNKTPCRLRDIQELFMDTGVGARGYSIIQQGQIAKIVQAKPEDRRTMIEEVAGIVKYKARRKESTRKLESTHQNLLRVTDVINELEIQKRHMERQADKARKYKEWKTRLQEIELRFSALKWEDSSNKLNAIEADIDQLTSEDTAISTARETAETQISQKRLELAQASQVAEEFQQGWMNATTQLNNAENELRFSQKNLDNLREVFAQLAKDTEEETALVETLTIQHDLLAKEAAGIDEAYTKAEQERSTLEKQASEEKQRSEQLEKDANMARQRLFLTTSNLDKAKNSALNAESRLKELEESKLRIEQERHEREATLEQVKAEKSQTTQLLSEAKAKTELLSQQVRSIAEAISLASTQLQEQRREAARLTSEQARLRTTLQTLEEQKKRHEGSSKGVKAVFQKLLPAHQDWQAQVSGTLADVLQVQPGMETAVETALGRAMDLILTSNAELHEALANELQGSESGRASFADVQRLRSLKANSSSVFSPPPQWAGDIAGPLSQFVQAQPNAIDGVSDLLQYLLDRVVAVRSATAASALAVEFPQHTFVTPNGSIFRGGWFMEGGDKSSVSGSYVGRNREIAELTDKVQEISIAIDQSAANVTELETSLRAAELEKKQAEESLRQQQSETSQIASREGGLNARANEAEKALQRLQQENERFLNEVSRLQTIEKEARVQIFSQETEKGALEVENERLLQALSAAKIAYEASQQLLMDARVKAANLKDQKSSLDGRRHQNRQSLDQHRNRIDSMLEQTKRKQEESSQTSSRITEIESQLSSLRTATIESEQQFRSAKERFDLLNHEVEIQRTAVQDHGARERSVKDALMNKRLEQQRVATDRELLAQNTFEHYGLTLAEYALSPETMEQVQLLREAGEQTIQDIQNEVLLLREKTRKLGDVNPAAVEEYDAIVERYNLLSTQKADLEKAMKDLQDTVDRINQVSKERFERAFAEVNDHFKRVFPVIFGGGHAHLTLTNPEDMLETGVDITAQPPGKKAQNINLLSGGEKTLTAISLLFSIFLVKPSPFCLLDEVDAPLDDANIGRFNALLREMAKRSQFIIITHNKRTMELNDKLYGVTMEDAGVSKMVSIMLSASA